MDKGMADLIGYSSLTAILAVSVVYTNGVIARTVGVIGLFILAFLLGMAVTQYVRIRELKAKQDDN
jgi:hypothetical protein